VKGSSSDRTMMTRRNVHDSIRSLWYHEQWIYDGAHRVMPGALALHRLWIDSADFGASNSHDRRRP
jgi:hypothetical protein